MDNEEDGDEQQQIRENFMERTESLTPTTHKRIEEREHLMVREHWWSNFKMLMTKAR